MRTKMGSTVHPRYKGIAKWRVNEIVSLSQPIEYSDPIQGKVSYDPKILLLKAPERGNILWFAYWIATSKTRGRMKWGQGPPMLEESAFLDLLTGAIRQGFFTTPFLRKLDNALETALSTGGA